MAIAKVTCVCATCDKEFTIRKQCLNRSDADDFEAYAASHYDECPDCYKARMAKEREEKRAAELADAVSYAKELALPALAGSVKQVAWAEKLRFDYIKYFDNYDYDEDIKACLLEHVALHTDSRYWIDNRSDYVAINTDVRKLWVAKYHADWRAKHPEWTAEKEEAFQKMLAENK